MDKFRNMTLFCRVVELGSFAKVAQDQNVTPAIIGRHMSDLEDYLGTRLLNRSTRSMTLTRQGQEYYNGCIELLNKTDELDESIITNNKSKPKGLLKISAPQALGSPFLIQLAQSFQEKYPEIRLDFDVSDNVSPILRENIDVALRLSISLEDSNLISRPLCKTPLILVASPQYLKQNGSPKKFSDLIQHNCILLKASKHTKSWPYYDGKVIKRFSPEWKLSFSENNTYLNAIESGLGIGMVPELFAINHLKSKKLVKVKLQKKEVMFTLFALYPTKKNLPLRTSLFLEQLKDTFSKL